MAKKITATVVEEMLNDKGVHPGKVFKTKGQFVARFYFYYTHGQTANGKATLVKVALPQAKIVDYVEMWNPWPKDSYFEVRFTLEGM